MPSAEGAVVRDAAFDRGVLVRPPGSGRVLGIAPPLIINRKQIDTIVRVMDESIDAVAERCGPDR